MSKNYFRRLTLEEKLILRDKGTEPAFSGEYNDHFEAGIFVCRACKSPLYESNTKFNSGCGWPSFDDEIDGAIKRYKDFTGGRERVEICCANCDGHLGHVFTGEGMTKKDTRHCVNSLSIRFQSYKNLEQATFGAGCFWFVEKYFSKIEGIYLIQVGYMGGEIKNPTYKLISSGKTNYAEVVNIYFNPKEIKFIDLLALFWKCHNPTLLNKQGKNIGKQYRSIIFPYTLQQKKDAQLSRDIEQDNWRQDILTEIVPATIFYRAEEYHQKYLEKNNLG